MDDYQKFTQFILNIRQKNAYSTIKTITLEERTKLYNLITDLTGYCKYLASQIEYRLKKENITTYWIDLNEFNLVDHVILIAEFMYESKLKRVLIDPSYSQFTKDNMHKLVGLKEWPSERLDKNILDSLLKDGIIEIDDNKFRNYLNSFGNIDWNFTLDEYLLAQKIDKITKR